MNGRGRRALAAAKHRKSFRKVLHALWLRSLATPTAGFRRELVGLFDAMRADLTPRLSLLEVSPTVRTLEVAFDVEPWTGRFLAAAEGHVEDACLSGASSEWAATRPEGRRLWAGWRRDFAGKASELPAEARRAVNRYASRILRKPYWRDVIPNVREAMARVIRDALRAGRPAREVADAVITLIGPRASERRATLIARTEMTGASNAGKEATRGVLARDGVVFSKVWVCTFQEETREDHKDAHEQEAGPGRYFSVGGERCLYPGDTRLSPSQRCNCFCGTYTVIKSPGEPASDQGEPADGEDEGSDG
jgi:hypothetical protein